VLSIIWIMAFVMAGSAYFSADAPEPAATKVAASK